MSGAWYEVMGGIGAGVGGLAAAAGWQAASASREASKNAADALALRPRLQIETFAIGEPEGTEHGVWTARVLNESAFVALDVVLETRFRDAVQARQEIERIQPGAFETFTLREIAAPPGGPTASQQGESLLVRYSETAAGALRSRLSLPPTPVRRLAYRRCDAGRRTEKNLRAVTLATMRAQG